MKQKQIILSPLYTEKMAGLQDTLNKYAFKVNPRANKIEVKQAIEKKFEVKVNAVHTLNVQGKVRQQLTRRGRFYGRRPSWKKAIVTLESGYKIDLFGNA